MSLEGTVSLGGPAGGQLPQRAGLLAVAEGNRVTDRTQDELTNAGTRQGGRPLANSAVAARRWTACSAAAAASLLTCSLPASLPAMQAATSSPVKMSGKWSVTSSLSGCRW